MAPVDLPLPVAVAGLPAPRQLTQLNTRLLLQCSGAFNRKLPSRSLTVKNLFVTVTAPPCKKYPKSSGTVQSHRRIAYFGEIYKRQGAKRRHKRPMSLFVVMRGVMGDSGNRANFQVTETGRSFETDPAKVAGGVGRACGASRGLRPACRRIRPRCRRGRYCERRR